MSVPVPTPWQQTVLAIPEQFNVAMLAGRGPGKTMASLFMILRHVVEYEARARVLLVRATLKSLSEVEADLEAFFAAAFGPGGFQYNRAEKIFRLNSGAVVELGQLNERKDYDKYQGRSYTFLIIGEFGLLKTPKYVNMLKANLRGAGVPTRVVIEANPGGVQHQYLHANFIGRGLAWHPVEFEEEQWVVARGTYKDNPHLDHADYERRLRAACAGDEALLLSWLRDDWTVARGAFFGGQLSTDVHMLGDDFFDTRPPCRTFIAGDWGMTAPSVVQFCLQPTEHFKHVAARSLCIIDEIATARDDDPNVGLGWPLGMLAEAIKERCAKLDVRAWGVFDDYKGLDQTVLTEFGKYGVNVQLPKKARLAGWAVMRELLNNAREQNGKPGLYVAARCKYFWQTVPVLPRSELRPEDVDTLAPDHSADCSRYAAMFSRVHTGSGTTTGHF